MAEKMWQGRYFMMPVACMSSSHSVQARIRRSPCRMQACWRRDIFRGENTPCEGKIAQRPFTEWQKTAGDSTHVRPRVLPMKE